MNDHRAVLKRVGLVLLVIGVLDIAYMVYCISHGQSYSSSFNIFSVVAGVFLMRGGLKTARLVTWFSAFMLVGLGGALFLLFPFQKPVGLWATEIRLNPVGVFGSILFGIAALATLAWVYTQMRAPTVVAAREAAGQKAGTPKLAFALGAILVAALAIILHFMLNGEASAKAIEIAKVEYGANYQYQVTTMRWVGDRVYANLTAYNEHEIKTVHVEWQK